MIRVSFALIAALAPAVVQPQASRRPPVATMARADSAYSSGDRGRARALYAEVLARDSTASRAVFRLAQLDESGERALALYRRYIVLEPGDAWGHMAEGDLLGRLGRVDEALVAYAGANAVAPGERDVFIGRARLLERAGRSTQAADELSAWVTRHPDDGEAWDLLGRSYLRSGRPRAASAAFERAVKSGVAGARTRWRAAHAGAAPFITPEVSSLGDSDGNRTTRYGAAIDVLPADGVRVGIAFRREAIASDAEEVSGTNLLGRFIAVLSPGMTLSGEAGPARFDGLRRAPGPPNANGAWQTVQAGARLRARMPAGGSSIDLRVERAPLGFNPELVLNQVTRTEARAVVDVPLGAFRARGSGRAGRLDALGESPNGRYSMEGGLLLPLGGKVLPSVLYRVSGFDRSSAAGYFAPQLARTVEAGAYFESGGDGVFTVEADVGAGLQRITEHGAMAGTWSRVWRAWAQGSVALAPSRTWTIEVEAYDAPFALEGASGAGSWRFLSVSTAIRWAIR